MSVKSQVLAVVKSIESASYFCDSCNAILEDTTTGQCSCGEELRPMSGFDWLEDALDVEWVLDSKREYKGARVMVAFGGPTIWVDVQHKIVEGYWWGEKYSEGFTDEIGLEDACEEWFNC